MIDTLTEFKKSIIEQIKGLDFSEPLSITELAHRGMNKNTNFVEMNEKFPELFVKGTTKYPSIFAVNNINRAVIMYLQYELILSVNSYLSQVTIDNIDEVIDNICDLSVNDIKNVWR